MSSQCLVAGRRTVLAALPFLLARPSLAQVSWPTRSIRLVSPFPPGGAGDTSARAIAPRLGEALGQTVMVENRSGGSGSVGAAVVAQAPPDGYTLLWDAPNFVVNGSLLRGLAFDYATAFAPISLAVNYPQVIAVRAGFPATNLEEFLAQAKSRSGGITVGTQGNGGAGHLGLVQLARRSGAQLVHVPYRGGADAARDLAAGSIDAVFITEIAVRSVIETRRANLIVAASATRIPSQPALPTLSESGFPGLVSDNWNGLFAPARTPAPIVARLAEALKSAVEDPTVRTRLDGIGAVPIGSPTEEFAPWIREEQRRAAKLVQDAGITID
jgi:tripartite-type tricarboxylate transporter receptor subunit TctC